MKDRPPIDSVSRPGGIVDEPSTNQGPGPSTRGHTHNDQLKEDESSTNPYTILYTTTKNRLIDDISSIIQKVVTVVPGEMVDQVITICLRSLEARKVVVAILGTRGFVVASLVVKTGVKRDTIYNLLEDLAPWVKKSDKTLEHPGRGPGPRAHVWLVDGEDLMRAVGEARGPYYEALKVSDPVIRRIEALKPISRKIADILIAKGVSLASQGDIKRENRKVPGLDPRDYKEVEKQVVVLLREYREADH